jgi:hypothetical protein
MSSERIDEKKAEGRSDEKADVLGSAVKGAVALSSRKLGSVVRR